ncbi:MAG: hypothetical protein R3F55_05595 [Alphaproteobacteria bacterium]
MHQMIRPARPLWPAAALLAATLSHAAAEEAGRQIVYPLAGLVQVAAPENAVAGMVMALYGTVTVTADGRVSGEGVIVYAQMDACAWQPPVPDRESTPYCTIETVVDGAFSVTGSVVATVHRHDADNPFRDGVFALADAHADARLDYAPLTLNLTLAVEREPVERLALWGFSQPGIQPGATQAAALGLHVSGLFGTAFDIVPIAMVPLADDAGAAAIAAARQFASAGTYAGGTPLSASGSLGFVDVDPAGLPTATNPWVYLQHAAAPAGARPLSEPELAAIEAYLAGDGPVAHDADRDMLAGGVQELAEGLRPIAEGTPLPIGPLVENGFPVGLLDLTRPTD